MVMKRILCVLGLILISYSSFSQHTLHLTIMGVDSSEGYVCVALYTDDASFLKFDKVFKATSEKAKKDDTHLEINDIPNGKYAIAVFHDKNGNKELDTNFLGIPKETVAFSNAKMKTFGPPKFEECAFKVASNSTLTIQIE